MRKAKTAGMTDWKAQWLFILTDIEGKADPSAFASVYEDGQNLSFMYNISTIEEGLNEPDIMKENSIYCLAKALLEVQMAALHQTIRTEETRYFQTTETDWIKAKPSAGGRSNDVFRVFKVVYFL